MPLSKFIKMEPTYVYTSKHIVIKYERIGSVVCCLGPKFADLDFLLSSSMKLLLVDNFL